MEVELFVTDITRMNEVRICLAAVDRDGRSVRPQHPFESFKVSWLYQDDRIIRHFTRLGLDLRRRRSNPPHTEDWDIAPDFIAVGDPLPAAEQQRFLRAIRDGSVASIFGAEIQRVDQQGTFILKGQGTRSLGTIRAARLFGFTHRMYNERWDYRISFADECGDEYRLKVVDLNFQTYIDYLRVVQGQSGEEIEASINQMLAGRTAFLRIGLARGWANYPDRCYLQINSIFTYPDYLEGRCFHEFITALRSAIPAPTGASPATGR